MENKHIYEIDGNCGKTLRVYDDRCVISSQSGLKSFLMGSALCGDKEFYYKDITSVQFKNIGTFSGGYMQFEYAGAHSSSNYSSENSFVFSASLGSSKYDYLRTKMPEIYEDIRQRVNNAKHASTAAASSSPSPAEEIKKYKELLYMGIITQDEFDSKKKQLLNL